MAATPAPHLTPGDALPAPAPASTTHTTATCHCGRVSLALPRPPAWTNECRCSVCYRYGARWAYYPQDEVDIAVNIPGTPSAAAAAAADDDGGLMMRSYVREDGDGHIAFFFCGRCGCLTHWGPTDAGLAFLRAEKEEKGDGAAEPRVGVNSRMLRPSLLEGVEGKVGKFQDFW